MRRRQTSLQLDSSEMKRHKVPNKTVLIQHKILGAFIIFFVSVILFWKTVDYDFVHDDIVTILRNRDIQSSTPWINLLRNDFWGMPMESPLSHKSYRPLTVLTFRSRILGIKLESCWFEEYSLPIIIHLSAPSTLKLNFALARDTSAYWFHLTNILIHGTVSVFVLFLCVGPLGMSPIAALPTTLLFALHPIHTEAVAGITGRADSLTCLLMLISFLLYWRCVEPRTTGQGWKLIISGLIGCLAMLAKETGITVIGINMAYDIYLHLPRLRRLMRSKVGIVTLHKLKRRLAFTFTLGLFSLSLRFVVNGALPQFGVEDNPASHAPLVTTRVLTYAFLPVFNFWLMLCPLYLSYDWQMSSIPLVTSISDSRNLTTIIFFTFLIIIISKVLKKAEVKSWLHRRVIIALLFTSLPFIPASNLFFPVGFVAAERVLYTPSVGICILIGSGLQHLKDHLDKNRRYTKLLLTVILCLTLFTFLVKTRQQSDVWKSRAALLESGFRENPGNAKAHYNYGNLQKDLGNLDEASRHYKTAIRLWPDYASAWNNLGAISNDIAFAELSFLNALRSNPGHIGAHFNLGVIYLRSRRDLEALKHLETVVFLLDPSHSRALQYLGVCYSRLNKTMEGKFFNQKIFVSNISQNQLVTASVYFLQHAAFELKR